MILTDKISIKAIYLDFLTISLSGTYNDIALEFTDEYGNCSCSCGLVKINATAPVVITGIADGEEGRILTLYNAGADPLHTVTLANDNANSAEDNRIAISSAADEILLIGEIREFIYISSRWRKVS